MDSPSCGASGLTLVAAGLCASIWIQPPREQRSAKKVIIRDVKVVLALAGAAFYFWFCFRPPQTIKWYVRLLAGVLGVYLLYDFIHRLLALR